MGADRLFIRDTNVPDSPGRGNYIFRVGMVLDRVGSQDTNVPDLQNLFQKINKVGCTKTVQYRVGLGPIWAGYERIKLNINGHVGKHSHQDLLGPWFSSPQLWILGLYGASVASRCCVEGLSTIRDGSG
jgi:hypothetical protein